MTERVLTSLGWVVAFLCVAPMLAAGLAAFGGDLGTWQGLMDTVLPRYALNTLALVILVAFGTAAIGTGAAWFVTMYSFPLRRVLEVLLALPLAFPAYVLAYAYTDLLDHPGLVQTLLREVTGWGPRDYWFPEIRSLPGAALMLVIVLYPYVYLLARAAFRQQSASAYLAARTLGQGPWRAFFRVCLPMARPAIAGGVLLTVMETIADYGTVAHFSVHTFSTGIYQAWFSMADRAAAAQLALCLLTFALLIALLERVQRGRARVAMKGGQLAAIAPTPVSGAAGWLMTLACAVPVLLGFVIPVLVLGAMALGSEQSLLSPRYVRFMSNSLTLASVAAVVTVLGAILIGFRARLVPGRTSRTLVIAAGLGYAVPGGVIAVGLLVPFASLDNAIDAWSREVFGVRTGLLITGSIWLMVIAYMGRFMAAALSAYDAGMAGVQPTMDPGRRPAKRPRDRI
ncbi:MAG: iron ABC transporter permease, partial [Pseudomonadota bacterium]